MAELLLKILNRIGDPAKVIDIQADNITAKCFENTNLKLIDNITLSEEIISALKGCKEADMAKLKLNMRQHFVASGLHILNKTSYSNKIVRSLRYISPAYILKPESGDEIFSVAKLLPFPIPSTAIDEFGLIKAHIQMEKLEKFKGRVDDFWNIIFDMKDPNGTRKFPAFTKIIKCMLSLTHGSADTERGFSVSGDVLTEDKTATTERTLNAKLNSKCGLNLFFGNSPILVPIDNNFIKSARYAYQNYSVYMAKCKEEEKQKQQEKDLAEQKRMENIEIYERIRLAKDDVERMESALSLKIKDQSNNATTLMAEANQRLKKAIAKKDIKEISIAQGMMEGANTLFDAESKQKQDIDELKAKVEKRKTEIIKSFIKKKAENSN